ncbi:MAG: hypothetical protein BGO98_27105 [Myxococcales bacterium 68-20]|nr:hypothetical protein [Myxococcales bacterium]OJY30394.1 MAG: hypothetical protein BGO98_27105 [Myxococcales bacterium 68-20]
MTAQAVWARMRVILGAVLALSAVGCGGTRSSVARLAGDGAEYAGPVTVAAATLPASYEVVGAVEVESIKSLDDALSAFVERVREVGGDHGQIDRYWTTFETRTVTSTESYPCGTTKSPQTCTRSVTRQQLVIASHYIGRAMRTAARIQ